MKIFLFSFSNIFFVFANLFPKIRFSSLQPHWRELWHLKFWGIFSCALSLIGIIEIILTFRFQDFAVEQYETQIEGNNSNVVYIKFRWIFYFYHLLLKPFNEKIILIWQRNMQSFSTNLRIVESVKINISEQSVKSFERKSAKRLKKNTMSYFVKTNANFAIAVRGVL